MRPQWVIDLEKTDFYNDYPTNRESGPGPLAERWYRQSKKWMFDFLKKELGVAPSDIIYNKMYFEWSIFAKVGDQWWYMNTGDIRFKIMGSLLVRKAASPKDYTGGPNQYVSYGSENFKESLLSIMNPRR